MKYRIPLIVLILVLLLAACGGSDGGAETPANDAGPIESAPTAETSNPNAGTGNTSGGLSEDYADALPVSTQLVIGSLQLENTAQAIDKAQASALLPLWQAYQALSNSDTTAQAELDAVIKQIQGAMQAEQIQAIAARELTSEIAVQIMQEQGIDFRGFGGGNRAGAAAGGGASPGGSLPGERPGGGLPGQGPGQLDPEARATAIAKRFGGEDASALLERAMLSALIRDLQVQTGEIEADQVAASGFAGRFLEPVAEASAVDIETLQAGLDEGKALADVIVENGGDLEAAGEALRGIFAERGLAGDELEQRIDSFLHGETSSSQ